MNNAVGDTPADPGQLTASAASPAPPASEPAPPRHPFDRQPGESDKAYAGFRAYLDLGPTRSITGAARQLGFKRGHFRYWATVFHWRIRAAAYEDHLAQVRRQAQEEALRKNIINWTHRTTVGHEQQWLLAQAALDAARQLLSDYLTKTRHDLHLADLNRTLETAAKLHRLAARLDQPPPPEPPDPNQGIHPDIMAALERAYGDPKPEPSTPAAPGCDTQTPNSEQSPPAQNQT